MTMTSLLRRLDEHCPLLPSRDYQVLLISSTDHLAAQTAILVFAQHKRSRGPIAESEYCCRTRLAVAQRGQYHGMVQCTRDIIAKEGVGALFKVFPDHLGWATR